MKRLYKSVYRLYECLTGRRSCLPGMHYYLEFTSTSVILYPSLPLVSPYVDLHDL